MTKMDNEPCPVAVPIGREKHIGFRFKKPGRGTVFVRPRDFSVWLAKAALADAYEGENAQQRLDRHDIMAAFAGGKPIKSFRK